MHTAVEQNAMMTMNRSNSDPELVDGCRSGDAQAMKALYTRHSRRVYTLALRMMGNEADAEEIVQDSFVRAWNKIDSFRGDSNFSTWLYRIALNLSKDRLKRQRPSHEAVEIADSVNYADTFARARLERALTQLPLGYREVLVMYDVMEMNHNQIAAVLSISVGTSKSQLHKARGQMRQLLKKSKITTAH